MKILTLIVHTNVQQELADLFRKIDQVSGYTFSHAEGHGSETESDSFLSARDEVVGYIPRIRVDILLEDAAVDVVLMKLCDKENSIAGQGAYWVTPVEKGGHLL